MKSVFYFIPLLLVVLVPGAFAQTPDLGIFETYTTIQNEDNTYTTSTHFPFLEINDSFVPYRIFDETNIVQVEVNGGKIVFDKINGATTLFQNGTSVINSDSYTVRSAELNTDNWSFLSVNDSPVTTTVLEEGNKVTVTFTRENSEGKFDVEYIIGGSIKTTAKFTNYIYDNHKFAFTQTLNLDDNIIELNDQTINLNDYIGQTFPREILEQNIDLVIEAKGLFYNSGLGFDNLWSVGIFDNNKIALDYANVDQTQTAIGETVELDPTFGYNVGSTYQINTPTGSGTSCPTPASTVPTAGGGRVWLAKSTDAGQICAKSVVKFDVSSIADGSSVSSVKVRWDGSMQGSSGYSWHMTKYSKDPAVETRLSSWNEITAQTHYVTGLTHATQTNTVTTLPSSANSDLSNDLSQGFFAIGAEVNTDVRQSLNYGHGWGANDWELQVTYTLPPPPNVPTNALISTQSTANQLDITWSAPTSGTTPDGYRLDRSVNGGSFSTLVSDTSNTSTSYLNTGLSPNTTYEYRIYSLSGTDTSTTYATATGVTTWNVPDQVTGLTGTSGANPSLSWNVPSSVDTLVNYKIYRQGVLHDTISIVSTTYVDSISIVSGSNYVYSVSGISAVGEGSQSASVNVIAGVPPDPPTGLNTIISNPNTSPLDITVSWSSPTTIGTGVLTGFELYRDSSLITTTGLVTTYSDTVPNSGSFIYSSKAISTHGTSILSTTSSITTPTIPSAITDLSGSPVSDVKINLSWSAPSNGGSNVDLYKIFKDGVQVDTTTSTTYSLTGLTGNTAYAITVFSNNSVGDSLVSNSVTETTYQAVSGSITITKTTVGATSKLEFTSTSTGTPAPNFNSFTLKEGATVLASGISTPYYLALNDGNPHTYTITSYDGTHWSTPTISGTVTETSAYSPTWNNNVSYNYTRANGVMDLTVNRDSQVLWDASCNYKTTAEVMNDEAGITSTHTGVWNISESQSIADISTVYVSCTDGTDTLFSFTSFGPNRLGGGIAQLNDTFDGMIGTPVALIFVLLVAGLFTGRSAPTGILLVLALVGVLGFVGMLAIEEAIWGFLLLAGVLGIFLGKRFL